jgi:hypothetical protein
MKNLLYLPLLLISGSLPVGSPDFINPTGIYLLKGEVKNNKIIGHSGELRVRLLDSITVAICLYLSKGYPGYESGAFTDTLHYGDNTVVYTPAGDSSCSIYFAFDVRTVEMFESLTDPHSGCGFLPGVLVPSIFEKTSSDIPVIQDFSPRGSSAN